MFELDQLSQLELQCMPRASETKSRQLFRFQFNGQCYWLKVQENDPAPDTQWRQQGFQRELEIYTQMAESSSTLPYQYLLLPIGFCGCTYPSQALILPDTQPIFTLPAAELSKDAILHRIFLALNALQGLHGRGLIHADLKRTHMVEYQKRAYLLDFEQVHIPNQEKADTHATPRYMAPELFQGQPKSIQTDLYALGIVLLEWLSGEKLAAQSYQEWAILHCQQLNIRLDRSFQCFSKLLQGLLAKQTDQRFSDIYAVNRFLMTEIE